MARDTFKYESNAGGIYRISMDVAKATITGNSQPTGAITDSNVEVEVAEFGRNRKFGLHPRGVVVSRVGTGVNLNKTFRVFIPAFTVASLNALLATTTFSYKGNDYTNPKGVPES